MSILPTGREAEIYERYRQHKSLPLPTCPLKLDCRSHCYWTCCIAAQNSARGIGELIAFIFIGGGILASIVSLATIPKFGSKNILWPTVAGIAVNGLLLAIAIPNFLHSRKQAIEQGIRAEKQTANWQQYRVAGLEILSPIELTKIDAVASFQRGQQYVHLTEEQRVAAEKNAETAEAYSGKLDDFTLSLNHRTLQPNENITVESISSQITQAIQQQFPKSFQSGSRDVVIDGIPTTRLTMQFQLQGRTAKVESLIVLSRSNLWQVQIFGPADMPQYGEIVEKILGSVKFLTNDFQPAP